MLPWLLLLAADVAPTSAVDVRTPTTVVEPRHEDMTFTDHLWWYSIDYAAVLGIGAAYALDGFDRLPIAPALLGPRFDPAAPNMLVLLDPRVDNVIGAPFVREKISTTGVILGDVAALLMVSALDAAVAHDLHRTHNLLLGGVESVAATYALTELFKHSFGRLRPDYRDRYLRAACGGTAPTQASAGVNCSEVLADGFVVSADELRDGQLSFLSGHASSSFAMASYLTWHLASSYVWHPDAPPWAPALAMLAAGTLMGTAGFVAASRIADHRHHPEDVVAGAALGTTIGSAMWWMHFGLDGKARKRGWSSSSSVQVSPQVSVVNGQSVVGAVVQGRW
jgi:membrane-associated phospholipid phosphatase